MQTLSSARRTCIASASAVECTATVGMPSSRQARWMRSAISPRLAMRIFWNELQRSRSSPRIMQRLRRIRPACCWPTRMRATVPAFGALIWLNVFIASISSSVWPALDALADGDEGRRAGLGRQVGDADHRAEHRAGMAGRRPARRRPARRRRPTCAIAGAARRHGRRRGAHDADAAVLLGDLDLGEAGLVQHCGERADRVGVELDAIAHAVLSSGVAIGGSTRSAMALSARA